MWKLSDQMEPALRELGERGDIVKAINRALKARGEERALESYSLHGEEAKTAVTGRVIDKRLTDELGERLGLIVDGVDGRVHHVALVPWRPVMDERLGRQIRGVVRDSGISWDFTRTHGIGIGR